MTLKTKPRTSKQVLVMATYKPGKSHRVLQKPTIRVLGDLTPTRYKSAVVSAYNNASATGNKNIIYSATRSGKTVKLTARLYQVQRDKAGVKRFKMFSAFHFPDGERLRKRAGLLLKFFQSTDKVYPSKPPFPKDKATLLRKMVRL